MFDGDFEQKRVRNRVKTAALVGMAVLFAIPATAGAKEKVVGAPRFDSCDLAKNATKQQSASQVAATGTAVPVTGTGMVMTNDGLLPKGRIIPASAFAASNAVPTLPATGIVRQPTVAVAPSLGTTTQNVPQTLQAPTVAPTAPATQTQLPVQQTPTTDTTSGDTTSGSGGTSASGSGDKSDEEPESDTDSSASQ